MKPGNLLRPLPPKQKRPFLQWSGYLLCLAGILLLSYCAFILLDARAFQAVQSQRFDEAVKLSQTKVPKGALAAPPEPLPPSEVALAAGERRSNSTPDGAPWGRIEIERISLVAMVMDGIDARTLRHAVGHIPGTALPNANGNVGIAGHRDTFFRGLRLVRKDDAIILTTLSGSYHYRVDSMLVLEPHEIWVLQDIGEEVLTLVTCYPFSFVGPAPQRFIVRARRIADAAASAAQPAP